MHKRVQLARNSTAPVIEYSYAYALPSDCLRVLKVHNGTTDSIASNIDYKLEGRNVVTDEGTVYLIYIALDTDPNNYDAYLREARFIDATENSLGTVEASEFTDARL